MLLVGGATAVVAYLIGSIPTSVWIGKSFFGVDIRERGSKNAGSTNAMRVLGWRAGLTVLFFDIFKGQNHFHQTLFEQS